MAMPAAPLVFPQTEIIAAAIVTHCLIGS